MVRRALEHPQVVVERRPAHARVDGLPAQAALGRGALHDADEGLLLGQVAGRVNFFQNPLSYPSVLKETEYLPIANI